MKRFWNKVDVQGPDDCWNWQASKCKGYGQFGFKGRNIRANRFVWYLHTGEFPPEGMCVCHTCDNPACVNPKHLFLGTQQENLSDMDDKGRRVNPPTAKPAWSLRQAKLVDSFIKRNGYGSARFIARWLGVSKATIHRMRTCNGLQNTRG